MGGIIKIGGWVAAIVAVGVAVGLGVQWRMTHTAWQAALNENEELKGQLQTLALLRTSVKETTTRLTEIEGKLATMEASLSAHDAGLPAGAPGAEAAPENAPAFGNLFKQLFKGESESDSESGPAFGNLFKEMFKGEQGKSLAKASVGMSVDMQYAALFKQWQLPADVEAQVRDIIVKGLEQEMETGLAVMSGGKVDWEKLRQDEEKSKARTREELSKVLSADELATYDQYQEELPRRMMEQQFDMQMTMFGSGLNTENRELVKQTLVDEMLADKKPGTMAEFSRAMNLDGQTAAIERVREQLRQQLDEEQFGHAERFLEQQLNNLRLAQQLMGGMFGAEEDKKTGATEGKSP